MAASRAADDAAKREVFANILARYGIARRIKAILDRFEGLKADEALMLAFPQGNAPFGIFQISREQWLSEKLIDGLIQNDTMPTLRKLRLRLKEALHLSL
ncbi:MAG: hypothetical protein WA935_08545 [Sphingopyxis granuli]